MDPNSEYPFHLHRKIAVVVPAYNEEKLIAKTVQGIPPWIYSIIIVDDASTDNTADIVRNMKISDARIAYRKLSQNQGVGRAIAEGYKYARELGCDIAAVMAGDNQMDPADLEALLYPVVIQVAGYVKGNRLAHPEASSMPLIRRIGTSALAYLTCAAAAIDSLHDMQCGFTALDLELLPLIDIDHLFPRYGYPNDIIFKLAAAQIEIAEVPVRPIYRNEKSGLSPRNVLLPITKILARGWLERLRRENA